MDYFDYRNGQLYCEGVAVDNIVREKGSPLYIYSANTLRDRYRSIAHAFQDVETTICFSVKCCSTRGVLQTLNDCGSGFDVVSGGELFRVIQAGGDPKKAVYAGVGKTDAEIAYAIDQDIFMFNVESEAELENINRIAGDMEKTASVALRLNPDVDPKTHRHTTTGKKENKFGLDLKLAGEIVDHIERYKNIRLMGLHVHLGSPINTIEPYAEALDKVLLFIEEHRSEQAPLEYINTGGGFGLLYKDENVPSFEDYASVIVPRVKSAGCKLILEPGRSIAGNAGILVGQIQYVKSNGEKTFVILDAGMNDLIRPAFYESFHLIWPTRTGCPPLPQRSTGMVNSQTPTTQLQTVDIVGPICESSDCFAKDRTIPHVKRGDNLAMFSAGAYGFTMSSTYNSHPRAAEILVDGDNWREIRKRETWEDLVAHENL